MRRFTRTAYARTLVVAAAALIGLSLSGCSLLSGPTIVPGSGSTSQGETTQDDADIFSIGVGDCLNYGGDEGSFTSVPVVDCSEAHESEAFDSIAADDGDYPGNEALITQSEAECTASFETFIGLPYEDSELEVSYFHPTKESWSEGDREILCIVLDPATNVSESLAGASR